MRQQDCTAIPHVHCLDFQETILCCKSNINHFIFTHIFFLYTATNKPLFVLLACGRVFIGISSSSFDSSLGIIREISLTFSGFKCSTASDNLSINTKASAAYRCANNLTKPYLQQLELTKQAVYAYLCAPDILGCVSKVCAWPRVIT